MPSICIRKYDPSGSLGLLEGLDSTVSHSQYVCVGDSIQVDSEEGFLRGHGTQMVDGQLIATLCGVVERVDKLVYVRPLKTRYDAAQGDVVVGRVTEVAGKRWRVDLAARQEAGLLLSAVHLQGSAQRRRNAEDELRMRDVLREADLLSAEVQSVQGDGSVALHTRSNKYGKLEGGQMILVPPGLVKRQKQHFHTLQQIGIDLILGCNGLIWVAPHRPLPTPSSETTTSSSALGEEESVISEQPPSAPPPTKPQLEAVVRVGNVIRALARCYLPIYVATIMDAYELALECGGPLSDIHQPDFMAALVKSEAVRRHTALVSGGGRR